VVRIEIEWLKILASYVQIEFNIIFTEHMIPKIVRETHDSLIVLNKGVELELETLKGRMAMNDSVKEP